LIERNRNNGRPKGRPHPWLSLVRAGFAFDMTVLAGARSVFYRAPKNSRAEMRRENECACHANTQQLAQRAPSPQRGEGWGEGVRTSEQILGLPNPLNLSFSPISAFTRVFDALWGRRDAARRPRSFSLFAARALRHETRRTEKVTMAASPIRPTADQVPWP
jgi:hypothetical protein